MSSTALIDAAGKRRREPFMSPRVTVHLSAARLLADGFATEHCNGIFLLLKLWGRLRTVSRTHNEGGGGESVLLRTWLATVRHLETKSKIARVGGELLVEMTLSFLPSLLPSSPLSLPSCFGALGQHEL